MEKGYKNLRKVGTLDRIVHASTVVRGPELEAPDAVRVTRIHITYPLGSSSVQVFGHVPERYVGHPVRLLQSYEPLPNGSRKFRTQMFVDCDPTTFEGGEEIIDMTIRRKY